MPHDTSHDTPHGAHIYLDNAASTAPSPRVCDEVLRVMREHYGNPSSLHAKGYEAEKLISGARAEILRAMPADGGRLVFTSGGTEANNMAISGVCSKPPRTRANRVVTTGTEHPSVLNPIKEAGARGWQISRCAVDAGGAIMPEELEALLDGDVALICFTHVNNETGAIQPLEQIAAIRGRKCPDALLHIDCVQSFTKIPFNPGRLCMDFASVSAHKIRGPKGVGALYMSARARVSPLVFGGGQEAGLRSGTENTPAIAGFGLAASIASADIALNAAHAEGLKSALIGALAESGVKFERIPQEGRCSPYILTLGFPGIPAELMLNRLSMDGVYVSSGAACSSRRRGRTGSHVLTEMRVKQSLIDSAIRFSFSCANTLAEIEASASAVKDAIAALS